MGILYSLTGITTSPVQSGLGAIRILGARREFIPRGWVYDKSPAGGEGAEEHHGQFQHFGTIFSGPERKVTLMAWSTDACLYSVRVKVA